MKIGQKIITHETSKFKTVTVSIRFSQNVEQKSHVARYLLSMMLADVSNKYPTKKSVSEVLDNYYGARLNVINDIIGYVDLIEFKCTMLNEKFVTTSLVEKQIDLLNEFINYPLLINNKFSDKLFLEMKKRLILIIKNNLDNPMNYASYNASKLVEDLVLKIPSLEDVEQCTLEDIENEYTKLFTDNYCQITILGENCSKFKEAILNSELSKLIKDQNDHNLCLIKNDFKRTYQDKQEIKKINQAQLVIMYNTNISVYDSSYAALLVANGILGGLPTSYLFQEIREKRSFCYSIYSLVNNYQKILTIKTSIKQENMQEVLELVEQQLQKVKNNEFSDEIIATSKLMYINNLRSAEDQISSLIAIEYRNSIMNKKRTFKDLIKDIENVTREDIVQVMSKLEKIIEYQLLNEVENDQKDM